MFGRKRIFQSDVFRYIAENPDFADELAKRLEIEADGGDSPGAFLAGVVEEWQAEERLATYERLANSERRKLGRPTHNGGESE